MRTSASGLGGGRFRLLNFCHERLTEKKSILPMFECSNMVLSTRAFNESWSSSSSSLDFFFSFLFLLQQHLRKISAKIAKKLKTTQSTGSTYRLKIKGVGISCRSKEQFFAIFGTGGVALVIVVVMNIVVFGGGGVVVVLPHLQPRQSNPAAERPSQLYRVGKRSTLVSQVSPSAFSGQIS